jgi:hypothetical protein
MKKKKEKILRIINAFERIKEELFFLIIRFRTDKSDASISKMIFIRTRLYDTCYFMNPCYYLKLFCSMRLYLLVLLALIYQIDGHGQHGSQPPSGQPPHVARKMEDYVHDMEYETFVY